MTIYITFISQSYLPYLIVFTILLSWINPATSSVSAYYWLHWPQHTWNDSMKWYAGILISCNCHNLPAISLAIFGLTNCIDGCQPACLPDCFMHCGMSCGMSCGPQTITSVRRRRRRLWWHMIWSWDVLLLGSRIAFLSTARTATRGTATTMFGAVAILSAATWRA